jgi:hypothetical protein
MSWIDTNYCAAQSFSFVFDEAPELSEGPSMQPALSITSAGLHPLSDVGQVLDYDGRTGFDTIQNAESLFLCRLKSTVSKDSIL